MTQKIPHPMLATEAVEIKFASAKNKEGVLEEYPLTYDLDFLSIPCFAYLQIWL